MLQDNDPEKLLRLPVVRTEAHNGTTIHTGLTENLERRRKAQLKKTAERNLSYFEQELQKLDDWADDLKHGLEQEIKETDREIKEIRRSAATAATLEEKLAWQKKQRRKLENQRSKQRRELFDKPVRN